MDSPTDPSTGQSDRPRTASRRSAVKTAVLTAVTGIASGCAVKSSAGPVRNATLNENRSTSTHTMATPQATPLAELAEDPAAEEVTLDYSFDPTNETQTAEFFINSQVISERSSKEEVEALRAELRRNLTEEQARALHDFVTENTSIHHRTAGSRTSHIEDRAGDRGDRITSLSLDGGDFESAPCPTEENPITGTHTHDLIVATALPCDSLDYYTQPDECRNRKPEGWKLIEFKAAEYSNTISFDVQCPHNVPQWPDSKIGATTEVPPPKTKYYALYNWKYDESHVQEEFGVRGGGQKVRSHYRAEFGRHFIDLTGAGSIRVGTDFVDIIMEGYKAGGEVRAQSASGSTGWGVDETPSI
jgi:hypothetical protein